MFLSVSERLMMLNVLPRETSRATGRILDEVTKELQLSKEELDSIQFCEQGMAFNDKEKGWIVVPPGQVMWDRTKEQPKDIEIIPFVMKLVEDKLKQMDGNGTLPRDMGAFYDRFYLKEEPNAAKKG